MAEQKYESNIETIPAPIEQVYAVLSNLQNVERVKDLIPQDKIQDIEISPDSVRMKVDGLGQKIAFCVLDRVENNTIKFGVNNLPMPIFFWIQLKSMSTNDTRVKLTLKADIPMMFRMMFEKKIQQGLDDGARMLTQFPYSQWL